MHRRRFVQAAGMAMAAASCTPGDSEPASGRAAESAAATTGFAVDIGAVEALATEAAAGPVHVAQFRANLVAVPDEHRAALADAYGPAFAHGIREGWLLLFEKCPHLGCRVSWCSSSDQFECPCHGSTFSPWGEHLGGPAVSGMLPVPVEVRDGRLHVTGVGLAGVQPGDPLPDGTDVTDHAPDGPGCLG